MRKKDKKIEVNDTGELRDEEITFDPADGDAPPADLDFYVKTIEELRTERDQYYDQMLRTQAEFDNFRKRVIREKEELRITARGEVLGELLPILDSAEKGLEELRKSESKADVEAYLEGYDLLIKNLHAVLERFGVNAVPGVGEAFDPNLHEAVTREIGTNVEDGEILEEFRRGYQIEGRLLRPSQVKVAVDSEPASSTEN